MKKPVEGVDTATVPVVTHQSPVHGRGLDPLRVPGEQLLAEGFHGGEILRCSSRCGQARGQDRVLGHRTTGIKPPALAGDLPQSRDLHPAHPLRTGYRPIGLAQPQPLNDLAVLIHLKPPVGHRAPLRQKA